MSKPSQNYRVPPKYGVIQFYWQPDISEHTPPESQLVRLVLDLPTLQGWKAELT